MKLEIGQCTDTGLQRDHNEDRLGIFEPRTDALRRREGVLCAVADGMGGHLAGEIASQTAIESLLREYGRQMERGSKDLRKALVNAVLSANRAVWEAGQNDPSRAGMGTTLVAVVIRGGRLIVAHVGDSPALLLSGGAVRRLTRDHSWVQEAVARGHLSAEDADRHPYKHVLTRALGSTPEVQVDVSDDVELEAGDVLVLCSDGLVRHVRESELSGVVQDKSAEEAARALVDLANRRGGEDNTTVIVCRLLPEQTRT